MLEAHENSRQGMDMNFYRILNKLRVAESLTEEQMKMINDRVRKPIEEKIKPTHLYPHRKNVP